MQLSEERRSQLIDLAACVVGTIAFVFPTWNGAQLIGGWDQTYFHAFDEAARKAVVEFGQLPLWNPYHCGGRTMIGHVASPAMHPLFYLLVVPFGTAIAYRMYLFLFTLAAMTGMVFWLRAHGATRAARWFGAWVFGSCGYFAWHYAGGHISYLGLSLAPWLVFLLEKRRGVAVGLLLASVFLMAGAYSFPIMVLLTFVYCVYWTIAERKLQPFLVGVKAGVVAALVTAFKFLPVFVFSHDNPRPTPLAESNLPFEIVRMLLDRTHFYGAFQNYSWTWPEYGSLIGYLMFLFALAGIFSSLSKNYRHEIFMLALFWLIACGNLASFAPYALLRNIPPYTQLRVPSRYMIFVALYMCMFGAHAMSRLDELWRPRRWLRYAAYGLAVLAAVEVMSFGGIELRRAYNTAKPKPVDNQFYLATVGNPQNEAMRAPLENFSIVNCYEEGANPKSALLRIGKNLPQAWIIPPAAGTAKLVKWTPNALELEATLTSTATLYINQNADPGWSSSIGVAGATQGMLTVELPAGTSSFEVRYAPRIFYAGTAVSALSLLALGALAWKRRKART